MFTRPRRRSLLSLGLAAFALVASSTTPAHADSQFFKNSTFNGCYVEFPSSQGTQNPDNCLDIGNQVESDEGGDGWNEYISCDVRDSSCHWELGASTRSAGSRGPTSAATATSSATGPRTIPSSPPMSTAMTRAIPASAPSTPSSTMSTATTATATTSL